MTAAPKIISSTCSFQTRQVRGGLKSALSVDATAELNGVRFSTEKKFSVRWKKTKPKG